MGKINIKLKSSFAVGATEEFLADFRDGHEVVLEFDEGTTIKELLLIFQCFIAVILFPLSTAVCIEPLIFGGDSQKSLKSS